MKSFPNPLTTDSEPDVAKGLWATTLLGGNWNNGRTALPILAQYKNITTNNNNNIILRGMAPKPKYDLNRDKLYKMYVEQDMTSDAIAAVVGCSPSLVLHYVKKYGIEQRPKYKRIAGERFGRLVAERFIRVGPQGAEWECLCDCGRKTIATAGDLGFGIVRSCGCLNREVHSTHGLTKSRQYHIWQSMKTRCMNPKAINYELYGGRGIRYDPAWESFENFWNEMKEDYADGLTLERIDNEAGYSRENCIWTTPAAQSRNQRRNVNLTHNGQTKVLIDWAREYGASPSNVYYWHESGMSDDEIFERLERGMGGLA